MRFVTRVNRDEFRAVDLFDCVIDLNDEYAVRLEDVEVANVTGCRFEANQLAPARRPAHERAQLAIGAGCGMVGLSGDFFTGSDAFVRIGIYGDGSLSMTGVVTRGAPLADLYLSDAAGAVFPPLVPGVDGAPRLRLNELAGAIVDRRQPRGVA